MAKLIDKINAKIDSIKKKQINLAYKNWNTELKEYLADLKKKGKISNFNLQKVSDLEIRVRFDIDI